MCPNLFNLKRMKPLIVLIGVFGITLVVTKIFQGRYKFLLSGRIALSAMLVFTAMAHFAFTQGMTMMLPSFIPYKTEVIYLTGAIEFAAAIGVLIPRLKAVTAFLLIVFFLLILPANIYAALNHINYQKATYDGSGTNYLWVRIPLQMLFMLWTYIFVIKFWKPG
ncbi:MAG: putative rane protein [Flaviaesturariibacter sp.]|nr:putative rane protein [Flaviaesturariibacter sp.]